MLKALTTNFQTGSIRLGVVPLFRTQVGIHVLTPPASKFDLLTASHQTWRLGGFNAG